ncbi:unnamed protein product [Acanthoscelides obtectus]|uniref:SEA domain-containing protein n=1 Tax=Acanthoscelides obtectus TaxID=200917 RepID=A0A9P0M4D5_ACAOB|nr:unnamed protein product [Acanthoscelides obtectus]CAK1627299.1 hypothetical protein AOBTE_LOCUS4495 [Acanthoscelides obtectus]
METYNCIPNTAKNKLRPNIAGSVHNVSRCTRPFAVDYGPAFSSKLSTVSVNHALPWQGRHPSTSAASCIDVERRSSRGKLCSIALAVASFVVLLAVLAIAGLALYLGILHTETPSPVLSFNCSVKVIKGDIFIGNLQEKMRKYKKQFETLYQRSILGPAFISCLVDRFGNDTQTIYFRLAFDRKKLSRSISNIEKAIKDILLTDAISRNSVFKNVRFDQRSLTVRQILSSSKEIPYSYAVSESATTKTILDSKPFNRATTSSFPTFRRNESRNEDTTTKKGSLVHGSFKISKTDADITEKKSDTSVEKPKAPATIKKTTLKDTSVTSALYKIAAIEKVTSTPLSSSTTPARITITSATTKIVTPKPTRPKTTTTKATLATMASNDAPWIPILPNMPGFPVLSNTNMFSSTNSPNMHQLIYSSFTNPGLSLNFNEAEKLGTTSLRSHPIPVNKIPLTENMNGHSTYEVTEAPSLFDDATKKDFGAVTTQDSPAADKYDKDEKQYIIRNISSVFHDLVSTLDTSELETASEILNGKVDEDEEIIERTGQVEVVMEETADLVSHTTKIPLVTLLPAKSNSGIGRPIRKRPYKIGQPEFAVEDRSFSGYPVFSINSERQDNHKNSFKVLGILNFANEGSLESRKDDTVRQSDSNPKIMLKVEA